MSKAKELFDESIISNIHKSMMLFKEDTDIIEEELDYAEKCHNLEEQLGCPLEAREKALQQGYIYNGFTKLLYICCRYDENGCYLTNGAVKFYVSEYKKTWWLKKDKSE